MLGRRIKPKAIAEQLGVSVQRVYNWSHAWRDSGVCGLMGGHNGGRPPALSDVDFHDEAPHAWGPPEGGVGSISVKSGGFSAEPLFVRLRSALTVFRRSQKRLR
jgi:hypothetical protein